MATEPIYRQGVLVTLKDLSKLCPSIQPTEGRLSYEDLFVRPVRVPLTALFAVNWNPGIISCERETCDLIALPNVTKQQYGRASRGLALRS
jgi:hypothetical protein